MTLDELKVAFGIQDGVFYRVARNKTEIEMLTDAEQSISTMANPEGVFIRVATEFTHADYTKVE